MHDLAQQFKALSEDVRLRILALIFRHGELCVCEVERFLQVSQSKASRHLRYLLNAGLVEDRRDGLWVYYRAPQPTSEDQATLIAALRQLLADVPVPDVSEELARLRAERCHPARMPAVSAGVEVAR
jgi:ArsR family transcriptional regulator